MMTSSSRRVLRRRVRSVDCLLDKCAPSERKMARAASWDKGGSGSLRTSPNVTRKSELVPESSRTAPVTPSHEPQRRRSPLITRRTKAASTPQLIEAKSSTKDDEIESCKDGEIEWVERSEVESIEAKDAVANVRSRNVNNAETVLQRFRKTFGLRFQRKGSKEGRTDSVDAAAAAIDATVEPSEEDDPPTSIQVPCVIEDPIEQKYRFGPLTWRSSKEKKKLNKAARSAKCNSGDSGIQIEMAVGSCGVGGDSSESHDTDDIPPDEPDTTPPTIRKRHNNKIRPHSDLLNQLLVDKLKPELKSRGQTSNQVRRTHSDLGGHRLLSYTTPYRRMMSSPAPLPRRNPPNIPQRNMLRRSLSQPLDMDKLLPKPTNFSEDDRVTSDELMVSDSESSSVASGTIRRKKSLELVSDEEVVILAEAVFDHVAIEAEELAFGAGDVVEVLETANRDWWWGSAGGRKGWFPAAFVRLRVSQEDTVEDCLAAMAGSNKGSVLRRRTSISLLSNDQVRTSVVRELVHTERDFVKVLTDVAEGYISECRKRKDMFSESQIQTIFINLEEILRFQLGFLKDLEGCIDWETPYKSCVGGCFLKHRDGFTMYSDYCNSHPVATATLQELYQYNSYGKFFEACRLMRGLIEIPLDGYLLTPVQRICKYPLQLAELLKYTKQDHEDYENIKEALKVMKDVAMFINERKRRMESLEKLAAWQMRVEGWEGEDLIETSSQLVHQGDVIRVKTGMWTNNITLFLFDHQAVYCKKDLLKKNAYVYKGRLSMDTTEVIDVPDGKDIHIGVTVRHAIKLYSCLRDKWLLFCCRNSSEKQRWLNAFAEERRLVSKDRTEGVEFPAAARQLARVAARCQRRRPPRKPRGMISASAAYMSSTLQLQQVSSNSLGRRMGGWFTFGGNKKARRRRNREDVS